MKVNYKFKGGDTVRFKYGTLEGKGQVIGAASTPLPVLGCMFIVNTLHGYTNIDIPNEEYPFTAITLPENCLELVPCEV